MADTLVASQETQDQDVYYVRQDGNANKYAGPQWLSASESFSVSSVIFYVWRDSVFSGNVWVEVWDDSGGAPNAKIGQSDSYSTALLGTSAAEFTFAFTTKPALTASSTYYFILNGSSNEGLIGMRGRSETTDWEIWEHSTGVWLVSGPTHQAGYIKVYKTAAGGTPINIALAVGGS